MPAPIRVGQLLSGVAPDTVTGTTNAEGTSQSVARADHQHRLEVDVSDDGAAIGARPEINFTGAGVVVTDDGGNERVNVAIAGPMGSAPNQELFSPAPVTGTDSLVATLANTPLASDVVEITLYLNGVLQNQGAGADYSVAGAGSNEITWLASSGTAIDLIAGDELRAVYRS